MMRSIATVLTVTLAPDQSSKTMTQSTLFICKSCCFSENHPEDQPADGATLLQQIQTDRSNQPDLHTIRIQPVGCLWDCGRACVVTYSAPRKPAYVFSSIPAASPQHPPQISCNLPNNTPQVKQEIFPTKNFQQSYKKFPL
ncbi:DUF1636 domain-containing protein [Leptolyngbya sp. NK1-12]|uniref:DUF1636 domain-containing protein n=1 Tax=Leptolyngbya sp. NK1-12 TaxID=2547451 RepID=A0AA97AF09_9CYAN|nr:DUF1636 domain-containing protein [Leptolyngbya sp. NK1-12]WNZ22665.1 DUF1636 domain-containing protein [Leptolyngbya sp. NK1-12]